MSAQDDMALAIGRMTMAWSRLHFNLFDLLFYISKDRDAARSEFFKQPRDEWQRDVVGRHFIAIFGAEHPLAQKLEVSISEASALAKARNAFIHTPLWEIADTEGVIQPDQRWHHRYEIKPDVIGQCANLQLRIEAVEDKIFDLIDEAIVVMISKSLSESPS